MFKELPKLEVLTTNEPLIISGNGMPLMSIPFLSADLSNDRIVVASALGSAAFFRDALSFFEPLVLAFLAVAISYFSPFDDA